MIKAIIFDLGGVLYELGEVSEKYRALCRKYKKSGESPWRDFKEEWNQAKLDEISCDEFYMAIANKLDSTKDEVKKIFLDNIKLNNEMKNLILELNKKYKIGILSNTIKDIFNKYLEIWNFSDIVTIVTSYGDKVKKPDKEAIVLIVKRLKVKKSEIVFIDDYEDTIKKYSNYGVKSVLYNLNFNTVKDLRLELKHFGVSV